MKTSKQSSPEVRKRVVNAAIFNNVLYRMERKSLFWQKFANLQSPTTSTLLVTALCIGVLGVTGCNEKDAKVSAPVATPIESGTAPVTAVLPFAYMLPTAAHLYEMIAPIALYPDKLVAQVLAGSTYPLEITQADRWLSDNSKLSPGQRSDAVVMQGWDPSVKSLTAFKRVLDQMSNNIPWTTALGLAFYNDPGDVLNAIQVMRQRASHAGQLKSNPRQLVAVSNTPSNYAPSPLTSSGNDTVRVVAPPQLITIVPAQADMVYVPSYNPQQIYGAPAAVYPGYIDSPPVYSVPSFSNSQIVTTSALTFGIGVVVGAALERHDWGWHAWSLNWGQPSNSDGNRPGYSHLQGVPANPPAVMYNQTTYISRSNTVVNNNVRNTFINNTTTNNNSNTAIAQQAQEAPARQLPAAQAPQVPALAPQQFSQPQKPRLVQNTALPPQTPKLQSQNANQQQTEQRMHQAQVHQVEQQRQQVQQATQINQLAAQLLQQQGQMQAHQKQVQLNQQKTQHQSQEKQLREHTQQQAQLQAQQKQMLRQQQLIQQAAQQKKRPKTISNRSGYKQRKSKI